MLEPQNDEKGEGGLKVEVTTEAATSSRGHRRSLRTSSSNSSSSGRSWSGREREE